MAPKPEGAAAAVLDDGQVCCPLLCRELPSRGDALFFALHAEINNEPLGGLGHPSGNETEAQDYHESGGPVYIS